jgi:phosphotransferase system enzyme I (PtsI)
LAELKLKSSVTRDGVKVDVLANIELPTEVTDVLASGASGIGLYRTEYLFLTRSAFPSFDEQYAAYCSILRKMKGNPVVIRTFDLGGDKVPDVSGQFFEANPFLGWRAIRFCLDRPEVFKIQLKALLKASNFGNLSIMIPMISNLEEIIETKKLLNECKEELKREKVKIAEKIPLGVMLEVPSAVMIAEHLAREVDFFSIGTNDLIQYTLAVDRDHELISKLYQSFHPSVLSLIRMSVQAAHRHKMKVSVCGEMAADPLAAILLIGLGVDQLSASSRSAGILKKVVMSISYSGAKKIAGRILEMKSHGEIEQYLKSEVSRVFPDIMPVIRFSRRNSDAGHN